MGKRSHKKFRAAEGPCCTVLTNDLFAHQCLQTRLSWRKWLVEDIGLTDRKGCGTVGLEAGEQQTCFFYFVTLHSRVLILKTLKIFYSSIYVYLHN